MKFYFLTMQLSAVFLLAALSAGAATSAQSTVSFTGKDVPLEQVFAAVKKQTGYTFVYYTEALQGAHKVTIDVKGITVEEFLQLCLKDQPLTYKVIGQTVMIAKKETKNLQPAAEESNVPVIRGQVTNEKGEPLAGASVTIKGTKRGTITGADGMFTLKGIETGTVLVVTYAGFIQKEVRVETTSNFSLALQPSNSPLDQVQVIAYGTIAKRLNTGDISTVTSKEIQEQPVSNTLAALEGIVPGLLINQSTGVPGGGYFVQIRGQNSIANGNDPLYIIDGVPYVSELLYSIGQSTGGGNPLNYINPNDIERVDVLKDADATAIYGSRGANGVILITTKKGKSGKTSFDFNLYSGVGKVERKMNLLNTPQYLEMRNEAFYNDSLANPSGYSEPNRYNAPDLIVWDTTRYTDWQKTLIGGSAKYTNAQVSVSGGNVNTQFLISGEYHKETTVFPGDFSDNKGAVHFNVSHASSDQKFKSILSATYMVDNDNLPMNDLTSEAMTLPPDAPKLFNTDGSLNWANGTWQNPFSFLLNTYNATTNNLVSNAIFSYKILSGLEIKTSLGYTNMQVNEISKTPIAYFNPAYNVKSGMANFNTNSIKSWIIEPQAGYECKLGKGLLNALLGTTIEESVSMGQLLVANGFTSDALLGDIQAASSVSVGSVTNAQYRYDAAFGRINYNWEEKYLLNVTARRDGSSRFGPGKQFGDFGAIGIGWIFSEEKFVKDNESPLSFGKIRFSYGTTGNDQIGDYRYLTLLNSTSNSLPYQGTQGLVPNNLSNPDLAWEINKKLEGGLDVGFFKDRLLITANCYRNRSSNQLVNYGLPSITGFQSVSANLPAIVQNLGFEFLLNASIIKTKDFSWRSIFNLSVPHNKLVAYPNLSSSPYSYSFVIGQPLTITKVYHMVGVNDTTGIYEFASKGGPTNNPVFGTDNTVIINTSPKFYGGFRNTFIYKGFQLDLFFRFIKQTGVNFLYSNSVMPGLEGNQPVTVLNRWRNPGDIKPIQRFNQDYSLYNAYNDALFSDQAYSDASYIRLKNVSLSYQVPTKWKAKIYSQEIRFFIQGQNLLTITKYKGWDPETLSSTSIPPLRVFTGGVQITL